MMNLFEAIFAERPSADAAILFEKRQITKAELQELALRCAAVLKVLNIEPGDRVAMLLSDSPEFVAVFISICSSGAIAVPVNLGLPLEEQRAILNDCTAKMAIAESDTCNTLLTDASERLQHLREVAVVRRNAGHEADLAMARVVGPNVRPLDKLLASVTPERDPSFPSPEADTPAFILYTSGSTGEPKGAVHSQEHVFYTDQTFCRQVLDLRKDDRLFSSSRLPFAYGLGNSFSFPLLNGAISVLCREKPTPEVISRIFGEYRPTIFFGVPVIYNLLLDHHRRGNKLDCSSLRLCISAGEALPAQLGEDWEKTFGVEVLDGIGSTEMLHMFMSNHPGQVKYGSSGTVLDGYEARLLDEHGQPVAVGNDGNLWIKGASAALNYWNLPDTTARTFVDGWVRTGDLYRRDEDGYWFHMGRSDDCFKSSGQWVSPVEVEGVLLRQPSVNRAAVVEDFDEAGLPCPCAYIICKDGSGDHATLEATLREFAKETLPRFKRPYRYVFCDELPYTATGKIQRFKLREELRKRRAISLY
jgi:benzoate-CoA ligase family protein